MLHLRFSLVVILSHCFTESDVKVCSSQVSPREATLTIQFLGCLCRVELGKVEDVINGYQSAQSTTLLIQNLHNAPTVVVFIKFMQVIGH